MGVAAAAPEVGVAAAADSSIAPFLLDPDLYDPDIWGRHVGRDVISSPERDGRLYRVRPGRGGAPNGPSEHACLRYSALFGFLSAVGAIVWQCSTPGFFAIPYTNIGNAGMGCCIFFGGLAVIFAILYAWKITCVALSRRAD